MSVHIDLNADLGEGCASDAELMPLITSASIACGFHASDPAGMLSTLRAAAKARIAVGAHPSLADREYFGRREMDISPEDAFALVAYQLGAFAALASATGIRPQHVKPHGALYNMAAREPSLADAVVRAVATIDRNLMIFAPPRSALATAAVVHGIPVVREFFADRNYQADGSLVPRTQPQAMLHDARAAADRVVEMLQHGSVQAIDGSTLSIQADTICVHGDTPEAIQFALELRTSLLAAGIRICAPSNSF